MRAFDCDCPAAHVQVTIAGAEPHVGVHLIEWSETPVGTFRYVSGVCPRDATEEDGMCDECRQFNKGVAV